MVMARGGVVENFESNPGVEKEGNSREETVCDIEEDPGTPGNHVFKLTWQAHTGSHVAGAVLSPEAVLAEAPGKVKITARVSQEQLGPECKKGLALRVVDRNKEVFQLPAPLANVGEPGWTELVWILDTVNPQSGPTPQSGQSWGATTDGVVDVPVKFLGFAIGFKGEQTNGGTLLVDEIAISDSTD